MIIIDCGLQIKRTEANKGAITDVWVNVGPIEGDGDKLEAAVFAGTGDGARQMMLILMTAEGVEYQVPIACSNAVEEGELAHYWTKNQTLKVAVLPEGNPQPYVVENRELPLESFFSQTAAYDLARVAQ